MELTVLDSAQMQSLGKKIGQQLRAGDYLVLTGQLGAGKTTFTQGIAIGLQVAGSVTSPTFVVSRIHKSLVGGPELIHIDAYRLSHRDQLLDLDLEDHPNSVVVIEWGREFISSLSDTWLDIELFRESEFNEDDPAAGIRKVKIISIGQRWDNLDLSGLS